LLRNDLDRDKKPSCLRISAEISMFWAFASEIRSLAELNSRHIEISADIRRQLVPHLDPKVAVGENLVI
jgi:hypothetical protein